MITQRLQNSDLGQINLLTIQEVAQWAKASTKTVYRWISDNKIPAIRLGNRTYRIPEKAIMSISTRWDTGALIDRLFSVAISLGEKSWQRPGMTRFISEIRHQQNGA